MIPVDPLHLVTNPVLMQKNDISVGLKTSFFRTHPSGFIWFQFFNCVFQFAVGYSLINKPQFGSELARTCLVFVRTALRGIG